MRLPRLGSVAMIAAAVLLTACRSSADSNGPDRSSTTTSTTTSTTVVATSSTSAPTTVPASSLPATTSTVSALEGPRIVSLTGPPLPVPCNAPTSVELRWETRGATTVTLRIDGGPVFATYGDGPNDKLVPLACDGNAHRYTLTAQAADGTVSTRMLTITERAR